MSSSPRLTLREFESCDIPLPTEVYRALRDRYTGKIDFAPTESPGVYRVTARDYVGRISMSGTVLVINPKVGVSNLFYMLCADAGLAHFHPPPSALAENPEIFPFIASALIKGIEALASAGLYREYQLREEDLPLIRGRINIQAQLRHHGNLKHRHICTYADFSADTAENRVIAAALRYMPALLPGDNSLLHRVRYLSQFFTGTTLLSPRDALCLVPSIKLHRLNAPYGPVLSLCRLVLRHLTLDERAGPHPFASFLVDMPRLFESFLTSRLRTLLPYYGLRVVAQRHDYLDEDRTVGIRPDILVYTRTGTRPLLVLDAKYRAPDEGGDLNRDLYQVSAYLDRYSLSQGVLVYPQKDATRARLKLRGTPKHLHLVTLDLTAAAPAALDQNCKALAEQIASLARAES